MAGGQAISIQLPFTPECVTTHQSEGKQTTSTPVQSVPSRQRSAESSSALVQSTRSAFALGVRFALTLSPSEGSCISTVCCPSCEQPLFVLESGCGVCGWMDAQSPRTKIQNPKSKSPRTEQKDDGIRKALTTKRSPCIVLRKERNRKAEQSKLTLSLHITN